MRLEIYQIDHDKDTDKASFMPFKDITKVDPAIYRKVFDADAEVNSLETLKEIVSSGLEENKAARRILELDQEIRELKDETTEMLKALTDLESDFDEETFSDLRQRLSALEDERKALLVSGETFMTGRRIDEINEVLNLLLHQPLEFDNALIRQLISRINVIDKDTIEITFVSGKTVTKDIWNKDRMLSFFN